MCNAIDKSPTQFPKPSAIMGKNGNKSQTSAIGDSLADPCLSNEDDFSMRGTQWKGGVTLSMCVFRVKRHIFVDEITIFINFSDRVCDNTELQFKYYPNVPCIYPNF